MPISSTAVSGDFSPTPFLTHTTKSGDQIESAKPVELEADLSTVDIVPSIENKPFYTSKYFIFGLILLIILICAGIAIPLALILTQSNNLTTSTTMTTTTMTTTTMTTATTTTANGSSSTSTTSTTRTTSTTTTTTTVTTTTTGSSLSCGTNETVYGLWNTIAGGDCSIATNGTGVGNYWPAQIPQYACDNNINDAYTNFGNCTSASSALSCGVGTGFYRTPLRGPSLLLGLIICTVSSLNARDPITITFEGSNQPAASLNLGSSWTLIYSGPSGLATDPGRTACGLPVLFSGNTVWYSSYRFLVTSKRGSDSSTWYSEVEFIGY